MKKNKTLRIKNVYCPISSLLRCCKYSRKGYYLRPSQTLIILEDWLNRDEKYRSRIIELFTKQDNGLGDLTQEEIDELESLFRID